MDEGHEDNDRLNRGNADDGLGSGKDKRLLRDHAGARVMAQRAAQLVVKNAAPRIMPRFKPGRCNDDVARVR